MAFAEIPLMKIAHLRQILKKRMDFKPLHCINAQAVFQGSRRFMRDDIVDIIDNIAKNRNCIKKGEEIDYNKTYNLIIDEFRSGTIGKVTLDELKIIYGLTD